MNAQEFFERIKQMVIASNTWTLLQALLILIAGWIVAMFLKKMVFTTLRKMKIEERMNRCMPESEAQHTLKAERFVSGLVFWILFLLTVIAALTRVNLDDTALPIREFLAKIIGYLPNLIGATLLAFVAFFAATVLRYVALTALQALHLDEKIESNIDTNGKEYRLSSSIASTIYWLVLICFAPTILNALSIKGITQPLEMMLEKVFLYLPNLLTAALIAAIGLIIASILRKIAIKFIASIHLDLPKNEGDFHFFEMRNVANLVGVVVYALIAIPVVIMSLSALQISALTDSVNHLFDTVLGTIGNLFGAFLVLFIAFIAGSFVSRFISQMLEGFGYDKLMRNIGLASKEPTPGSSTPSELVGKIVLTGIMLFAAIAACEIMNLNNLAEIIRSFLPFAGNLILAAVILAGGIYFANLASSAVQSHGFESQIFALAIKIVILFFAGAIALDTAKIGGTVVLIGFGLILGAFAIAFAIAFGLGGREIAAHKLSEWIKSDTPANKQEDTSTDKQ